MLLYLYGILNLDSTLLRHKCTLDNNKCPFDGKVVEADKSTSFMRANVILLLDEQPENKPETKTETKADAEKKFETETKADAKSDGDSKIISITNFNLGNAHTEEEISRLLSELDDKHVRIECDSSYRNKNELVAVYISM